MYDPKFTQKQMYDQYGSSRETTKKADPKPSRSSGFGGMGSDPAEQFGGSPTRGIGAKPPSFSNTFGGGQDNNPNRDEYENKSTIDKVKEKAVNLFESLGADKPKALIVDGKRVYQGPLFSGYDPTVRIGPFGGDAGKKQYRFGMPILGEVSPSYPSPTLPPADNNPTLNMFGVRRGFTGGPEGLQAAPTMTQPASPATARSAAMTAGINRILKEVVAPNSKEYKIKKGDTLSRIAVREGVTVDDLVKINGIEDKNKIYAGDSIIIPKPEEVEQAKEFVLRVSTRGDENPDAQFYQSTVPEEDREFEPELGADSQSVSGYDDVPQTLTGLMSRPTIVKKDFETVEAAQQRLNDLGYTTLVGPLETDGKLGGGTARQLRKFQKTAGISVTGKLDGATKKALKNNKFNNKEGKDRNATVVPLQDGLFEIIKAPVAKIESGGEAQPYATVGGDGMQYDGKYQFGWRAKTDLRNNPDITPEEIAKLQQMELKQFNKLSDEDKARVGEEIQTSRAAFRADSELQEKAFRLYVDQNHETLTKNSAKYRAMDQANQLAVLGYAHNQGAENALEWLTTSVVGTDAFGTKGDKYSKAITEIFTKDDMLG